MYVRRIWGVLWYCMLDFYSSNEVRIVQHVSSIRMGASGREWRVPLRGYGGNASVYHRY